VAESIGCDGRLPLIAHSEADPGLRREASFRGKCGGNDRAYKQDRESEPGTSVGAVESQGNKTSGELGGKAAKARYRGKAGFVNQNGGQASLPSHRLAQGLSVGHSSVGGSGHPH
jgi:hypothetical protein